MTVVVDAVSLGLSRVMRTSTSTEIAASTIAIPYEPVRLKFS